MLKPGGGFGADDAPPGTNDAAPGLKAKLEALGLRPVPLFWSLCRRLAGLTGGGAALSSQESPMIADRFNLQAAAAGLHLVQDGSSIGGTRQPVDSRQCFATDGLFMRSSKCKYFMIRYVGTNAIQTKRAYPD